MTNAEAADIVEYLVGAYPGTYFKGPTAEVFVNSLLMNDKTVSEEAAKHWVQTMDRFPTIAELNGVIRARRERDRGNELPRAQTHVATKAEAREAFSRGYIRARSEVGEDMETIQPKLEAHLRAWRLAPPIDEEHPAHTD